MALIALQFGSTGRSRCCCSGPFLRGTAHESKSKCARCRIRLAGSVAWKFFSRLENAWRYCKRQWVTTLRCLCTTSKLRATCHPAASEKHWLDAMHFLPQQKCGISIKASRGICTYYFGRRTDVKKHRPNVLAVYADRPSKLGNARPAKGTPPCLHIEWRVSGSPALEGYGIVSLDDLIQFDHPRFWNEHIRLYQLPKPTPLGQLLANACGADSGVSGSALRKRAAQWRNKYSLCENFVMHNAIRETPGVEKKLKTIAFSAWLEEVISL